MLSLKPESSQKQLDTLDQFCNDWGIEVNDLKTQVVIFERNSTNNHAFLLKGKALDIVETYCYLGIVLHSTGELRTAQSTLKTKAMRAFGLKRTVIRSKLSFKSLAILFESLIKAIVLYGPQFGLQVVQPTSQLSNTVQLTQLTCKISFQK